MTKDTVRDVMNDRIRGLLAEFFRSFPGIDFEELIHEIADETFLICGISEKEQDEEKKND